MNKKIKKIIIAATVLIAIAAIVLYVVWNKPHRNVQSADAAKITATELYRVFITDSAKARNLYVNKVVEVSGEITQLSLNQQSQQVILIKTAIPGAAVNCTMEEKAGNIKAGDLISIKGICSGYISGDADMGLPGDVFLIRGYHKK